ncbi:polyA polymerase catalytic subunit PAPL [Equine parapoxvirus]|nr:polyA polymerase catalytic subunit PAPL [Equine parapoxvirus]
MGGSAIEEYLGARPSLDRSAVIRAQRRNVARVLSFDRKLFLSLVVKSRRRFFKRMGGSEREISERIEEYFSRQRRVERLGQVLAVLELQTTLVTEFTRTLGALTAPMPAINVAARRVDTRPAAALARRALESYMVEGLPPEESLGRHKHSDLVDVVKRLMKEHLRRNNKRCVCYGSYSLHLLNPAIEYGDIDMVQTNARPFLINLALLIYFVTGRATVLLRVPYLKNYVVLHDEEGGHILDSFGIRQSTLRCLPTLMVDNIYILHPFVQLMAALKMFSQTDRIHDLAGNPSKALVRMETLLAFALEELGPPEGGGMPLECAFRRRGDAPSRVLEARAEGMGFGFERALVFLDEPALAQAILDLGAPESDILDFESVSNSSFLVHDGTLYTHFSNTVLMVGDAVHDISRRGISAHVVMFLLLTAHPAAEGAVRAMIASVVSDGRPVTSVVERSRKMGTHGVIDIAKNVITH